MGHEVLKEMEKALGENKTLETLRLNYENYDDESHKEFCRQILCGIQLNTSLSEVDLKFESFTWDCPIDGRLVYVSRMLCDSVGCSV